MQFKSSTAASKESMQIKAEKTEKSMRGGASKSYMFVLNSPQWLLKLNQWNCTGGLNCQVLRSFPPIIQFCHSLEYFLLQAKNVFDHPSWRVIAWLLSTCGLPFLRADTACPGPLLHCVVLRWDGGVVGQSRAQMWVVGAMWVFILSYEGSWKVILCLQ